MNTMLDPEDLESEIIDPISTTWSDYDGDSVYGDFEMIAGAATDIRSFEPGIGKFDWSGVDPDANSVQFYHANQIGTTRFMTDPGGTRIESSLSLYTAFGERVDGTNHRYGYAGAWGYQTHDDLPFLHVGHRYYDPVAGRFLQRDPIGLAGGLNVYEYVRSSPTLWIDLEGAERHKLRNPKTGKFRKTSLWKRVGKGTGWATLACILIELADRHLIPRLDEWIEDNYEDEMEELNEPAPPPPEPTPGPPPDPPRWEWPPCSTPVS